MSMEHKALSDSHKSGSALIRSVKLANTRGNDVTIEPEGQGQELYSFSLRFLDPPSLMKRLLLKVTPFEGVARFVSCVL